MKRVLPLVSLPALCLSASTALAQQPAPSTPLDTARTALAEGRYDDADKLARQAGSASKGAALAIEAQALASQGKLDAAIALLDGNKSLPGVDGRRVRLVLGELLVRAGRRADAEPVLMTLVDDYNNDVITSSDSEGNAMLGHALHLLRHPKDAATAFKAAMRAQTPSAQAHLWWAALFADNFDPGDAEAEIVEALKLDARSADAMVMEARLKMDDAFDFEAAGKLLDKAQAINPKHTGAFAVRAGMDLRDGDLDAANAEIDKGLAVNAGDLELLSLRAAARFLADDPPATRPRRSRSSPATRSTPAPTASSASTRSGSTATTTSSR
jgi:cellulose synthase operon protein C